MLGLVAVDKKVSQEWFEQVLEEPVRSASGDVCTCTHDDVFKAKMLMGLDQSVPLLLQSLKRIWCWIDNDMETPTDPAVQAKAIL
ncbi:hypothetical protein CEP51_015093 [Fusarium floridanum]|uniref:Uncharacterized protein n=1 Tax=Fusarium floridanum TaxID=1325733 RepID=A0A428PGQ7_9HYPO|nr:hypothetical protein CEP51_015093 [Fusarium floridanum]